MAADITHTKSYKNMLNLAGLRSVKKYSTDYQIVHSVLQSVNYPTVVRLVEFGTNLVLNIHSNTMSTDHSMILH